MNDTTKDTRAPSRSNSTREEAARPKQWQPASLLPTPVAEEGFGFRWIRKDLMGKEDPTNVSRKIREGWEFCRLKDYPEMEHAVDSSARSSGMIETGGLVLCKMPIEMVQQREAYYRNRTAAQASSVDNNFMRENDARMPLFKDKKSDVTFGRG